MLVNNETQDAIGYIRLISVHKKDFLIKKLY